MNKTHGTRQRWGFTITELIVVAIIIGVLAAIAMPSYRIQMLKMKNQEAIRVLMVLWEAQKEYYRENGGYYFGGILAGRLDNINANLDLEIPMPKYFGEPYTYGDGGGLTCTQGFKQGAAFIMDNDAMTTYVLAVMEDGRIVCVGAPAADCSAPICRKMGFDTNW